MTACILTGLEWWTNVLPIVALTLFARWICVGMWHECQRERQREQRRRDETSDATSIDWPGPDAA
jgi:hypothetical protein